MIFTHYVMSKRPGELSYAIDHFFLNEQSAQDWANSYRRVYPKWKLEVVGR